MLQGNNHPLVKRVLDTRASWHQIKASHTLYHLKWAPVSGQIRFDFMGKHGQKNLVNHFENHAVLTTKDQLFQNMTKHCELLHEDVHEFMPVTFVVDVGNSAGMIELDKFTTYFHVVEKYKKQCTDSAEARKTLETINKALSTHGNLVEKRRCYRTITLRESMFDGQNIWLLKPSDYNRGRGVSLFNSLEQLKRLIGELTSKKQSEPIKE